MGTKQHDKLDLDLDMLAYDISDLLDRSEYPIGGDISADEILRALPVFLAALGLDANGQPLGHPFSKPADQPTPPADPEPITRHVCNLNRPGQPLPFGRKAPAGDCPRCDELRAGAEPRQAPAWIERYRAARDAGDSRAEEIREHFAPGGPHERGACGLVCTKFDW
jgi:hypothetical protein